MREIELDLRGLLCPLPVLKARKALEAMPYGGILVVTATDPMSAVDMPHFCLEQGHELLHQEKRDADFIFKVRRR